MKRNGKRRRQTFEKGTDGTRRGEVEGTSAVYVVEEGISTLSEEQLDDLEVSKCARCG